MVEGAAIRILAGQGNANIADRAVVVGADIALEPGVEEVLGHPHVVASGVVLTVARDLTADVDIEGRRARDPIGGRLAHNAVVNVHSAGGGLTPGAFGALLERQGARRGDRQFLGAGVGLQFHRQQLFDQIDAHIEIVVVDHRLIDGEPDRAPGDDRLARRQIDRDAICRVQHPAFGPALRRKDADGEIEYARELAQRQEHAGTGRIDVHGVRQGQVAGVHLHPQQIVGAERLRIGRNDQIADQIVLRRGAPGDARGGQGHQSRACGARRHHGAISVVVASTSPFAASSSR